MSNDKTCFSRIVCSAATVRKALPEPPTMRQWWRCILALHGKPVRGICTERERIDCIAAGFKFYAHLYRFLAVLFLLLAPGVFFCNLGANAQSSLYWALATLLAGIYLWNITALGYAGAAAYRRQLRQARASLLAFMVMIVAFLSAFVAVISLVAQHFSLMPVQANLVVCSLLFVLGIGSYFIEVIYLATEQPGEAKLAGTSAGG